MPRQFLFFCPPFSVTLCCQEYANFDEVGLDHKDRDSRGLVRWQTSKIGKLLLLRLNQRIDSAFLFYFLRNILLTYYVWNFFKTNLQRATVSVSYLLSAPKIHPMDFVFQTFSVAKNDTFSHEFFVESRPVTRSGWRRRRDACATPRRTSPRWRCGIAWWAGSGGGFQGGIPWPWFRWYEQFHRMRFFEKRILW